MQIIRNKIAIYGLALSGIALKNWLQRNTDISIYLFDDDPSKLEASRYEKNTFVCRPCELNWKEVSFLIVSPGIDIRTKVEHVKYAQESSVKIVCDIELFYYFLKEKNRTAQIIGITGTNGKSTTTALVGHVLQCAHVRAQVGGNIGVPVFELDFESDVYVLEVSSYQLDLLTETRFDIGVLLNITPDHLERYDFNISNYVNSKRKLFDLSGQIVLGIDSTITNQIYSNLNAHSTFSTCSVKHAVASYLCSMDDYCDVLRVKHTAEVIRFKASLIGLHNRENICAAFAVCHLLTLNSLAIVNGIESFKGLAHRIQTIPNSNANGLEFVNDSKATSGDATVSALNAFSGSNVEIYLIIGGVAKSDGLSALVELLGRVKKFYLIGSSAADFSDFLKRHNCAFDMCGTLDVACRRSTSDASSSRFDGKKLIILSPACASFDQFKNFEDRGEQFIKIVSGLSV
jgi:UDP-N-acetylmuramoylalanine--D-glutamate ligase